MGVDWRPLTERELARMTTPSNTGTDKDAPDLSHIPYEEEPEFRDPLEAEDSEDE